MVTNQLIDFDKWVITMTQNKVFFIYFRKLLITPRADIIDIILPSHAAKYNKKILFYTSSIIKKIADNILKFTYLKWSFYYTGCYCRHTNCTLWNYKCSSSVGL